MVDPLIHNGGNDCREKTDAQFDYDCGCGVFIQTRSLVYLFGQNCVNPDIGISLDL